VDHQPDHLLLERFLDATESATLFDELLASVPWRDDRIAIFGRTYDVPRRTAWFGDPGAVYAYSRIVHEPEPWTPVLSSLRDRVSAVADAPFNSVLINWYRDGRDSNGWHADNEPELGAEPVIASLSLGATRTMRFRHVRTRNTFGLPLSDGDLLLMWGDAQVVWQHTIAKATKVTSGRVNLTFRYVLPTGDR
jgi:alkylated DNA repair dioxygenase AlkB